MTLCGEMGGRPLEAMALIALGYRDLSMSAAAIGPVKAMVAVARRSSGAREVEALLAEGGDDASLREPLRALASALRRPPLANRRPASVSLARVKRNHGRQRQSRSHPAPPPGNRRPPHRGRAAAEYAALSRELAELEPVVAAIKAFRAKEKERADLEALLDDPGSRRRDARAGAAELAAAEAEAEEMAKAIRVSLLPKDAADEGNVILEVRAGTGGDEAALFAGDLFRMYVKYAERRRWKVEVLSVSEGTAGGYKEIVAEIAGRGAFARLKFESGVHRVQRVPATETQGRIHTSAATVAVLPMPRRRISSSTRPISRSTRCARAAPAASTSTRPKSAIRITHLPTGVVVAVQEERSQHRNRAKAMALLRSRILDAQQPEARRRAGAGPALAGRLGRPLAAHPHLQFPAGPGDRPPHQPDALYARPASWRARASTRSSTRSPPSARRSCSAQQASA